MRRWVNTTPPSLNTPAQVQGQLMGHENGVPVLRIDKLTYLPKLATSTPRHTATASASASPTAGGCLFGSCKRKMVISDDAEDAIDVGPSSPSKCPQGNATSGTLLNKLQITATEAEESLSPPPDASPPIVPVSLPGSSSPVMPPPPALDSAVGTKRSTGKRRAA